MQFILKINSRGKVGFINNLCYNVPAITPDEYLKLRKKGWFVMSLAQENRKYTYADYLTWPENERWEIVDGIAYMQVAPSWEHQRILAQIGRQFLNYFQGKPCEIYLAPFDVRLPEGNEVDEDTETTG